MEKYATIKIAILRNIFDKNGRTGSYTIYRKLKLPIADYMKAVSELESSKAIEFDGDWLSITEIGKQHLNQSRPKSNIVSLRGIPQNFLRGSKISVTDPYIPSISRLDILLRKKLQRANVLAERANSSS